MARGRFLSKDVSTSEKLADLPSDFARMLWSWCVPHTDRDGRLPGSARALRALVVPMLDKTLFEVEGAIGDLCESKLMLRYQDPTRDGRVLLLLRHEEHQVGMRYDREAVSKYGPPPDLVPTNAGPAPTVENRSGPAEVPRRSGTPPSEGKVREVKSSEAKPSAREAAAAAPKEETPDQPASPIDKFRRELQEHDVFARLNFRDLAEQIEGERMQTGKSEDAVVAAIGEAASNADGCRAANDPKTARELVGMLKGFCRKARNPTPRAEAVHAAHVASEKRSPTTVAGYISANKTGVDLPAEGKGVPMPAGFMAVMDSIPGPSNGKGRKKPVEGHADEPQVSEAERARRIEKAAKDLERLNQEAG